MSTTDNQSLLSAPGQQTAVDIGTQGGRSSRAYKVTGLTLLACVLIMGQAAIAYFLVTQRSDIKSLKEQNDNMRTQLTQARSASVPMRMQMPMNTLDAALMDEDISTGPASKDSAPRTQCQLEREGLKPVPLPNFRPACDKQGLYEPQQCFIGTCWCVVPLTGEQIPGSVANGQAHCRKAGVRASIPVIGNFE